MISTHKSINELYSDLCMELRKLQVEDAKGESLCQWCAEMKRRHLSDNRCNISVLSQHFTPIWKDEKKRIERALSLLEELKNL